MSSIIYFASNRPISHRPNPHEKLISVNEAITAGIKVPEYMLHEYSDRDKPDAVMVSDRNININIDTGIITDGDFDDDFAVIPAENISGMRSDKKYFAVLEFHRLTEGRAHKIIEYIENQLNTTDEIELWHIWLGAEDEYHSLKSKRFSVSRLSSDDILNLEKQKLWDDVITSDIEIIYDYCYVITK